MPEVPEWPAHGSGKSLPTPLAALFAAVAFGYLGNGLLGTATGPRASLKEMPTSLAGIAMPAFFVGYAAGSVLAPRLIQGNGHIRSFAALASVASLLFPILVSVPVWIAFRRILGACFAGILIVVESWMNAGAARQSRRRLPALYGMTVDAGRGGGQLLLMAAPAKGFVLFALSSILFSLALVPVTLSPAGVPGWCWPNARGSAGSSLSRGWRSRAPSRSASRWGPSGAWRRAGARRRGA
jgi:hypothetical protein